MKISVKGDYALRAMLDLCFYYDEGKVVSVTEISKRQNIPLKYLEQIMLLLKSAGYVGSKRGIGGGFFLLRHPSEISLGEIIRLIEGGIGPVNYKKNSKGKQDMQVEQDAFSEVWMKVTDAIKAIVDHVTFADMMRRTEELRQKRMGYTYQI